ncbi:MAG: DUF971 domain-containing protein [Planctomycetota bacterium]
MTDPRPMPVASPRYHVDLIELLEPDQLLIVWGDGHESLFSYRELRLRCSCARCVDEWTREALLQPAAVPADIKITKWEPTGRYGLNLHFSDAHSSGIYLLRALRQWSEDGLPATPEDSQ